MTVYRSQCDFYQAIHRQMFSLREINISNQSGVCLNTISYVFG